MLKFFRKYNKIILTVFGTMLMVVFLTMWAGCDLGSGPDLPGLL